MNYDPPIDPCPFCGHKGPEIGDAAEVWVECGECQARGPAARVGCRDDEEEIDLVREAITMWNRAAWDK